MSGSLFTPKINREIPDEQDVVSVHQGNDTTSVTLQRVAQYAVIVLVGLTPVFFVPGLWASLGFGKSLLAMVLGVVVIIAMSLLMLRRQQARTVWPLALTFFWGLVAVALVSGLLSGDMQDAVRGSVLEPQTVGFLGILAIAMTIPLVLQGSKRLTIKALAGFGLMATLLLLYNLLRLVFGPEFLAFGSFGALTVSPVGGFNDLAIFAGLAVIFGLVTLAQLPLRGLMQYFISGLVLLSLIILAVVNFFYIWIIVGFFGLLLFVYLLSRDTLFRNPAEIQKTNISRGLILTTLAVCIVSAVFIVAGEYAGAKVGAMTNINYVEVRPSLGATVDIIKGVYSDDFLLGAGPNRFADVWRLHKDRSINETIFWDTDFEAGNGFVPTLFVNLGVLGGALIVLFHLYFIFIGYKMLLRSTSNDSYWYYFGVVTFTSAFFLWLMSYIYVPGSGILLLTALFTGLFFVAYGALMPSAIKTIPLAVSRQRGFFLMAAIILVITTTVSVLFSVGKQYVAQADFNKALATSSSPESFEQVALTSTNLFLDDRFLSARAQIHLANLNSLLGVAEPSEEEQQRFVTSSEQALFFAQQAVAKDDTNPDNHFVLAAIYSNLGLLGGGEGAQERAAAELNRAQELDPLNPGYHLLAAQMAARIGDIEKSREEINLALGLKNNYTEALFLSTQLDISEGKTESAIATTKAIINLEPRNPTRYFQLGVLLSASEKIPEAIAAYQAAITLDTNYANARYMLALDLAKSGQSEAALEQLRFVQKSNEDNEQLKTLIKQIENGEEVASPSSSLGNQAPIKDREANEQSITPEDVSSDLINNVNTISDSPVVGPTVPDSPVISEPVVSDVTTEESPE